MRKKRFFVTPGKYYTFFYTGLRQTRACVRTLVAAVTAGVCSRASECVCSSVRVGTRGSIGCGGGGEVAAVAEYI